MPTTLPNLPNLAGTNVTPNVPAHVLSDTDITIVNSSTTPGIGADRKVTLGELKSSIVTPITNPIAETVSAITSKAILVDLKDANGTTGVYPLDMAGYACDLHVLVVNSTSVAPPVSPGYFTLQIANTLPAGATIHISGAIGGTVGTTLPVRVNFTNAYSLGLGQILYPSPAFIPLINGGHLSAIVAYNGVAWCVDSTDIIAMDAYIKASSYGRGTTLARGSLTSTTGMIPNAVTNLSDAFIALGSGNWLISATAFVSNTDSFGHRVKLEIGALSGAPTFGDDSCACFTVVAPPSGETYGYAQVPIPPKIVTGDVSYSIWGFSTASAAVALRGWVITAIPTA